MKNIKITEEQLLKLGFEQSDDDLFELVLLEIKTPEYHNIHLWTRTEYGLVIFMGIYQGEDPLQTDTALPHIKHVHELQNLYFALTGIELSYENEL
jgi:hypothetical protein